MYRLAKRTTGRADVLASFNSAPLALLLAIEDVRQRYRRSVLGPFWITITQAILIATLAFVFGIVLGSSMAKLLPSLAIGIILWTFISGSVQDGCTSFILAEQIIRQLPIPLFIQIQRVVVRNIVILLHNAVLIPAILAFSVGFSWTDFLSVPGLALLVANLLWSALLVAVICTRFRDMPQIIANMLQVAFYLSPVIWLPELLPSGHHLWLLELNPFYHLLEIVRAPLLGKLPAMESWIVSGVMAVLGWLLAIFTFSRYRHRIPYWL